MTDRLIRIKEYEQAADDKVSIGSIKWLRKWDVCIQCDTLEEAVRIRSVLLQRPNKAAEDIGEPL